MRLRALVFGVWCLVFAGLFSAAAAVVIQPHRFTAPDADVTNYLSRVASAGGTLNATEQSAVTTLVLALKASGVWTNLIELGVMNCGDAAASLVKLKYVNGSDLVSHGSPVFYRGLGYEGAASSWLDTTVVPSSHGMAARDQSYGVLQGCRNTHSGVLIGNDVVYVGYQDGVNLDASFVGVSPLFSAWGGSLLTVTADGNNVKAYTGTTLSDTKASGTTATAATTEIFRFNGGFNGTAQATVGAYFMGKKLTAGDVASINTALVAHGKSVLGAQLDTSKILFAGDSITFGAGASDGAHRWTTLLATALGKTEVNQGESGWYLQNTPWAGNSGVNLKAHFWDHCVSFKTGEIYLMYGVNDERSSDGGYTASSFQTHLDNVVAILIEKGWLPSQIHIGSPPYIDPTDAGIGPATYAVQQTYAAAALAVAQAYHTYYADVQLYMYNNGGDSLLGDKVHPNDTGHLAIKTAWLSQSVQ